MDEPETKLNRQGLLAALAPCLSVVLQAFILWGIFGGALPPRVMAYLAVAGVGSLFSALFLAIWLPVLANRRGLSLIKASRSDRLWFASLAALTALIMPAVAGLELMTFRAAAFGDVGFLLGVTIYAVSFFLTNWAMLHNQHFVVAVTLPGEDESALAATGPYRFVRHPGYLAMTLSSFAPPLLLGSTMALLPALMLTSLLIWRTIREDRFLRQGLANFANYESKVRHRLIPGVW